MLLPSGTEIKDFEQFLGDQVCAIQLRGLSQITLGFESARRLVIWASRFDDGDLKLDWEIIDDGPAPTGLPVERSG
jgi:hypothetical protein